VGNFITTAFIIKIKIPAVNKNPNFHLITCPEAAVILKKENDENEYFNDDWNAGKRGNMGTGC